METIKSSCYVFQTDSDIVNKAYQELDNYMIEYNEDGDKDLCVIYFSSNDIYYPNLEEIFRKRILEKNSFEWYNTRITKAYKHIFIRDIFKQWYLAGINKNINSPEKLTDFLTRETNGYKVITIGSSAGGYAAILYGAHLNTEYSLVFNPQFEIKSLLNISSESTDPLIFRLKETKKQYFDITKYIGEDYKIFYFYSNSSKWDVEQYIYLYKATKKINKLEFHTKHHGIPFLKVALPVVLNSDISLLEKETCKIHNPIIYTIKKVGIVKTISGFIKQVQQAYIKRKKYDYTNNKIHNVTK